MESNMELQILHAIQGIHQEWLTEILRFFTTMGESGLVWIVIAIVLTCIPKTRKCGQGTPAPSTALISSPSFQKSAERIEGDKIFMILLISAP
jgi:hypothetical protein